MDGVSEPIQRPHCRTRDACVSKGAGHCRGCSAARTGAERMAAITADPEALAAWKAKACHQWQQPAAAAARVAAFKRNRTAKRRVGAAGRKHFRKINADPEVMRRRAEGVAASVAQRVRTIAARLAVKVGIPVELVDEFRWLRLHKRKTFTEAQAIAFLEEKNPEAFAPIRAERDRVRAATIRSLGPAPAIGMPGRAAWTRRANAIQTGLQG